MFQPKQRVFVYSFLVKVEKRHAAFPFESSCVTIGHVGENRGRKKADPVTTENKAAMRIEVKANFPQTVNPSPPCVSAGTFFTWHSSPWGVCGGFTHRLVQSPVTWKLSVGQSHDSAQIWGQLHLAHKQTQRHSKYPVEAKTKTHWYLCGTVYCQFHQPCTTRNKRKTWFASIQSDPIICKAKT